MELLKFSKANAKTKALYSLGIVPDGKAVYSLDLPAGYTCPGAKDCLSHCVNGKIQDGPKCRFRCFSASQEVTFPVVHAARMHNFRLIKEARTEVRITKLITASLPKDAGVVRYHVSGDFFSASYFNAAVRVARTNPDILFYGYTKSLPLVLPHMFYPPSGMVRENFLLTASRGGKWDQMATDTEMREAIVVFSEQEAEDLGLEIDHDDSHAAKQGGSFALLLHGVQPPRSEASAALSLIKRGKAAV